MTSDTQAAASAYARPLPQADDESREFYEGARRHELMLMRCLNCRGWRLPSRPRCPDCWATETEWAKASGRAKLYSFGIMHQKFPGFEGDAPYNFAIVELAEGPRIVSNIVDVPDASLRCDMPLRAVFDDVADDTTLIRFAPE